MTILGHPALTRSRKMRDQVRGCVCTHTSLAGTTIKFPFSHSVNRQFRFIHQFIYEKRRKTDRIFPTDETDNDFSLHLVTSRLRSSDALNTVVAGCPHPATFVASGLCSTDLVIVPMLWRQDNNRKLCRALNWSARMGGFFEKSRLSGYKVIQIMEN
jgi:hypothetical protein